MGSNVVLTLEAASAAKAAGLGSRSARTLDDS